MGWGDLTKFATMRQLLRRGLGLPHTAQTMRSQDSVLFCVRPLPNSVEFDQHGNRLKLKLGKARWPEDKLIVDFYRKNPDARLIPYSLDSFEAPFPKRFALRQLEVMGTGRTREEAYAVVLQEMGAELDSLRREVQRRAGQLADEGGQAGRVSALAAVQEEEEKHLTAAMQQLRKAQ